jgi:cyclase
LTKLHLFILFAELITDNKTNDVTHERSWLSNGCGKEISPATARREAGLPLVKSRASDPNPERTKGHTRMKPSFLQQQISRREMLRYSSTFAGSALLATFFSTGLLGASTKGYAQQPPSPADLLADMRARFNAAPLETQRLGEHVTMLSGPGGSVVVLNGPDGKFVVDTFVAPAWPRFKKALDELGNAPVKCLIDTHWHFDHTDNNAPLHAAGATVLAHENTKKRMSEAHDLPVLHRGPDGALAGLHFDPSPVQALPQQTFAITYKLEANGETIALEHVAPAHTDTDIYVHFEKANVIQMGDLFFNGMYPYIDPSTGGKITGTIAAADKILSLADNDTKVVAGHGPLGNKGDLTRFRDMLVTTRDRVEKLKSAGKSAHEAVAERPFADLEDVWGKGIINGDQFVQLVYLTL